MKKIKDFLSATCTKNNILSFVGFALIFSASYTAIKTLTTDYLILESMPKSLLRGFFTFTSISLCIILLKNTFNLYRQKKATKSCSLNTIIINLLLTLIAIPIFIISIYSWLFIDHGFQTIFNKNVKAAIVESVSVAEAYFDEHKNTIIQSALSVAHDLNNSSLALTAAPSLWQQIIEAQVVLRGLSEAVVFRPDQIIAKNSMSFSLTFEKIPVEVMEKASRGQIVTFQGESKDSVRALFKLSNFSNIYLLVGKYIDSRVLNHIENTKNAYVSYNKFQQNIVDLKVNFFTLLSTITLMLVSASIIIGSVFAEGLTKPIAKLATTAKKISNGDLTARSNVILTNIYEINSFYIAFDNMALQLERQHKQIIDRKNFIENILLEISSGVIVINKDMQIELANKFAQNTLGLPNGILPPIQKCFRELHEIIMGNNNYKRSFSEHQINITLTNSRNITLLLKVNKQVISSDKYRYIVTFDNITDRISAQKAAAWSDVAPRIAHEIKNPLTPINLAIIRIKKLYSMKLSEEDNKSLSKYIKTIEKQVNNISNTISEFIDFSENSEKKMQLYNLNTIVDNAINDYDIEKTIQIKKRSEEIFVNCNSDQITKAIINLIKNSNEAMSKSQTKKLIVITDIINKKTAEISIIDSGVGFRNDIIDKASEPYVTTKSKGSGLGLSIVKKIISDHNGTMTIKNLEKGSQVSLFIPLSQKQ